MRSFNQFVLFLSSFIFFYSQASYSGDFQWSGLYRVEGIQLNHSNLVSSGPEKSYGLHHLILMPKIEAADGLTIRSRFDIFNSTAYPNSQVGAFFGSGVGTSSPPGSSANNSNSLAQTQQSEDLKITQLYMTLVQEYGALLVGRVPLQFGLGMVHNAGNGVFDHWYDTRDLVGYKFIFGNLYLLPMYGKVNEGNLTDNDDVNDLLIQLGYSNPESGLEMGFFYQSRKANDSGVDTPDATKSSIIGGAGSVDSGRLSTQTYNFFAAKEKDTYRWAFEFAMQGGDLGVVTSSSQSVTLKGYGLAFEYEYRPLASKYKFGFKTGVATGDDPSTDNIFEGFQMDKNYQVAMLLFHHFVGQNDFLRTQPLRGSTTSANDVDVEAVSNAYYLSPYVNYKWNDRWNLKSSLTLGQLYVEPISGVNMSKNLGYEWDISFEFAPNKNFTWVNGLGVLFPGSAFQGGSLGYGNSTSYGLMTKAAIRF